MKIAATLACLALPVYAWLMLLWKSHGVFAQFNIVFDTDPNARLLSIAHGWTPEGLAHPLLSYLFSLPLRVIAFVSGHPEALRESISLWIAPVLSSLKVAVAYLGARALGSTVKAGIALAVLTGFSLAPAVFGALPEHQPISAFVLTCAFAWAAVVQFGQVRDRYVVWLLLAIAAMGLTITNIVAILALFCLSVRSAGRSWTASLTASAKLLAVAAVVTLGCSYVGGTIARKPDSIGQTKQFTQTYLRQPEFEHIARFAVSLGESIAAPAPATIPNTQSVAGKNEQNIQFSYDAVPLDLWTWIRTATILGLIGAGAWRGWRTEPRYRPLVIAAIVTVLWNGLLHTFWGTEWLLYSMHWHVALVMLFAGWTVGRGSAAGTWIVLGTSIVAAVNAALVIRGMLLLLKQA